MAYGVIYVITNLTDGMKYVGQTTRSVKHQFNQHANNQKSLIGQSIRTYGKGNFTIEVLEECENPEQLDEREKFWIAHFDCISPNGYNKTNGGSGNYTVLPETCDKIIATNTGRKRSLETCKRISEVQIGKQIPDAQRKKMSVTHKGKKFSDEHRANLSASQKGRPKKSSSIYPVLAKEMIRQKISYSKLAEHLGYSQATISKKMQGKTSFTLAQMETIRNFLQVETPLEELFRRAE